MKEDQQIIYSEKRRKTTQQMKYIPQGRNNCKHGDKLYLKIKHKSRLAEISLEMFPFDHTAIITMVAFMY